MSDSQSEGTICNSPLVVYGDSQSEGTICNSPLVVYVLLINTKYVIFTQWRQIIFNLPFEFFSISFIVSGVLKL